jgi:hypothetical protein
VAKTYSNNIAARENSCSANNTNLIADQSLASVSNTMTGTGVCAYQLNIETKTYKQASISIWFEVLTGVEAYILVGPGEFNVYNAIQLEGPAFIGAPFILEAVNSTIFVVAGLSPSRTSGKLQFGY